jgi:hypothetical protein
VSPSNLRTLPLLIVLALGGCGRTESRDVATVRGRVLFQGRPLAGGVIVFAPHPDRGAAGKTATADIDANGEYKLRLDGQPYVRGGWYRVAIADPPGWTIPIPGETPRLSAVSPFPDALRRPDKSGLEREVVVGRENEFEFHIEVR